MKIKKSLKFICVFVMVSVWLVACQPSPTPIPSKDIENINITENNILKGQITQTRFFDQCDAAGPITTIVQFSENSSQSSQKELVISAGGEAGATIPGDIVSLKLQGAIEEHFAVTRASGSGYQESVQITIPDHTQQESTIVWQETRREGTITYIENGETKYANYSYRIGLQFLSSSAKKIDCAIQITETPTPEPATATSPSSPTPTPVVKTLADGCLYAGTWLIDSTDRNTLNTIATKSDGCYDTGSLGIFSDRSGTLHILDAKKRTALASGNYTPINNDSVVEFKVYVNSMYIVNPDTPVYISFAVAPFGDPLTAKNTARFKLQVEDTKNSPLIYFVMADAGENNGSKFPSQHYEYGRAYTIRFELTGSIMSVFVNNTKLNENLSIPSGSKVFYIGYNLPTFAGVDVEITNIKIDGALK
ncbi:MAG: hypothetical protein ABI904_23770 [Chloroflexota bacterium]